MIVHSASAQLRARTTAIPDPGSLLDYLTETDAYAFIRDGDGVIGFGEIARFETDSLDAADLWWQTFCEDIEDESEIPGTYGTGPIAFGSFTFDPDHTRTDSLLIVPEVVIGRRDGLAWMTVIGLNSPHSDHPEKTDPPRVPVNPRAVEASTTPEEWMKRAAEIIERILQGEAEKVVLARDKLVKTDAEIDPRWLIGGLLEKYPRCWVYSFDGFIGATPEMLLRQKDQLATSRVLAGTVPAPTKKIPKVVEERSSELLASEKNQNEHAFARDSVAEALQPFCNAVHVPEAPYVLKLPNVLHLASDIAGSVKPGNTSLAVTSAIHPTAAVCGSPRHVSAQIIADTEGFDRGRYAGPVGWIDSRGDGEWALGLRCGQLSADRKSMRIFAGCGLVDDSIPEEELAETEVKFKPMLNAFGLDE